jgi:hypothetical protein
MTIDPWNADYKKFSDDIFSLVNDQNTRTKHKDDYQRQYEELKKINDAAVWLMFFLCKDAFSYSDLSISGIHDEKIGVLGDELKAESDFGQLTNDLQNTTTDSNPSNGVQQLKDFASHLDIILDQLYDPHSLLNANNCFSDMDDMMKSLKQNLLDLRRLVYWGGDTDAQHTYSDGTTINFNPDTTKDTYYFDPEKQADLIKGHYQGFSQMLEEMANKQYSDKATEADKKITNTFSSASATTGGINAGLNEEVSLETNFQKSFQTFASQLLKDFKDLVQAIVTNQKTG